MKTYTVVFLIAALGSLLMTPLIIRMSHAFGLVDRPGVRKVHKKPIPRVGGIAIALPFFLATLPVLQLDNGVSRELHLMLLEVSLFLIAAAIVFVMGFFDDAYGLRARTKFLVQLMAATAVYAAGVRVEHFSVFNWGVVELGWLSYPLTMLWIVGITNAINLLDGLDGLAAGTTAISCGLLAFFAVMQGDQVMAVVCLALAGALSGFLYFNFNPAKIFMGDSGSQFIGFTVATAAAMTANKAQTAVAVMLPVLALGVPIFDTLLSMLRRFLGRRSLFGPDRGHIHHRLLERGLSHRRTVLTIYALNTIVAGFGVAITIQRDSRTMLAFAASLVLLFLVFRWSGVFRVRESVRKLRHNSRAAEAVREHARNFEYASLMVQEATTFREWWKAITEASQTLEVDRLRLSWTNRAGATEEIAWSNPLPACHENKHVALISTLPVRDRRRASQLQLQVTLGNQLTLESTVRRVAYLARLLDESPCFAPLPDSPKNQSQRFGFQTDETQGRAISERLAH